MSDSPAPWSLLDSWMADAAATEPDVPDAMQIATVGADGRPSLRTVLLKAWGVDEGLVFYTNLRSRKGLELAANPSVAVLLHWKTRMRQIIAEGSVGPVTDGEADAYWASRPRGSQIGGWASAQSEPLESRSVLEARVAEITARFEGQSVPRPVHWSGFRLDPERFEFWQGRRDRLHERRLFTRTKAGWDEGALYP